MKKAIEAARPTILPAAWIEPRGRASLLKYTWANTTWRTIETTIDALIIVCNLANQLTVANYQSIDETYDAIGSAIGKPGVEKSVIGKLLLSGDRWGIFRVNKDAALPAEKWIEVTPSGTCLVAAENPYTAAIWLVVNSPVCYSDKKFNRPGVAILSFASECCKNIGYFTGGEFVAFAATKTGETNWSSNVERIKKARANKRTDRELVAAALKRDISNKQLLDVIQKVLEAMFTHQLTAKEAEARIRTEIPVLAPGARGSRRELLIENLVPYVVTGKAKQAWEILQQNIIETAVDSELDYCTAAIKNCEQLGLLSRIRNQQTKTDEYQITDLGRAVLADCQPLSKTFLKECIKSSQRESLPNYLNTCDKKTRLERVVRDLKEDPSARARHADNLNWDGIYKGMSDSGGYELAVSLGVLCSVETHPNFDITAGIRTPIDADLKATSHARGGDADAVVSLSNGDIILIQSTGNTGEAQVDAESTSIARHHRVAMEKHPESRIVSVLVAPEVSPKTVSHHIGGEAWLDGVPKILLALAESQLRRILLAGGRLEVLIDRVADLFNTVGETPVSSMRSVCENYINEIENGVQEIERAGALSLPDHKILGRKP